MVELDLVTVFSNLAGRRAIFHSESDFQFALAWEIQAGYAGADIRLEPRPRRGIHLDVLVQLDGVRVALELKYLVRTFAGVVAGEMFDLPGQGAQDISRYDIVKDVVRVEQLLRDGYADVGYVIALTNDSAYWRPGMRIDTIDAAFRIHEGRTLSGELKWDRRAGLGTTAHREKPLALHGQYRCDWRDFSTLRGAEIQPASFRYLLLQVAPAAPLSPFGTEDTRRLSDPSPIARNFAADTRWNRARADSGFCAELGGPIQ